MCTTWLIEIEIRKQSDDFSPTVLQQFNQCAPQCLGHIEVLRCQNLHLSRFHQTTWCLSYHQFQCFFVENDKGSFIATVVANFNLEPAVQEMKYQPYSSMTSVIVAVQMKLAT